MRLAVVAALVLVLTAVLAMDPGMARADLSPPPVWQGDTLLGPAKSAAQLVKATFDYTASTKAISVKLGSKSVQMTLGSKSARVNGKAITLTAAPKIVKNTTYVPLKTLFTGLGYEVHASGSDAWVVCTGQMCIRVKVPPKP